MNDIYDGGEGAYKIEFFRHPYVHTTVKTFYPDGWNPNGVELTIDRAGIGISGWFDSMVGLPGFRLTWEQLDQLRKLEKIT